VCSCPYSKTICMGAKCWGALFGFVLCGRSGESSPFPFAEGRNSFLFLRENLRRRLGGPWCQRPNSTLLKAVRWGALGPFACICRIDFCKRKANLFFSRFFPLSSFAKTARRRRGVNGCMGGCREMCVCKGVGRRWCV
jgi:hypothetical protein